MRTQTGKWLAFLSLCTTLFLTVQMTAQGKELELNRVRAVVNGQPITQLDLNEAIKLRVRVYLLKNRGMVTASQASRHIQKMEESALQDLIDRKLILSEFKAKGFTVADKHVDRAVERFVQARYQGDQEKFLQQLENQGLNLRQFRDMQREQIAIQVLQKQRGAPQTQAVAPEEREKKLQQVKEELTAGAKVILHMISIPKTDKQSDPAAIRARLLKGESFADVAKAVSKDTFAKRGGFVGPIDRDTLNEKLTGIAYKLEPGKLSEVIEDGIFWRIIYTEGRAEMNLPSEAELQAVVDKRINDEKQQNITDAWLKQLRQNANVRIYE